MVHTILQDAQLPKEEAQDVRILLNDFVERTAARVSGFGVVKEKDRTIQIATIDGLKPRGHFTSVEWSDTGVAVSGE
jgi:hypothetical protein